MIYPQNFELKTGFNQIRDLVKEHCLFVPGQKKVDEIRFSADFKAIKEHLELTAEFRHICLFEEDFPVDNYLDVTPGLMKIRVEGTYLETREVFDLKRSLETVKLILRFIAGLSEEKYPRLKHLTGNVKFYDYVNERIEVILTKQGKIKDNASADLRNIRNQIRDHQAAAGKKLQRILKGAAATGLIEKDASMSIRNGRQVIPVPSSNKRKISGIIHDESATGKTVFIEPSEIVEINNSIRELEIAEMREIMKILVAFTDSIRPYIDDLLASFDFLATIDFIRAKALFAIKIGAGLPALVNDTGFRWKQTMHPLLYLHLKKDNKEIVPLDIQLDNTNRIVLISGPNAGGKSVCLKTVGLIQYMLQCGMLVPMIESSETGIFEHILIDIGDEQSIENDLSTYSSHLLNMKSFLKNASSQSIILIDEFGAGTEPQIGGAMAEAILESLNQKGTYGVVTTHYANLKHFASATPGIINGAMMFDTSRMLPLYKLDIGKPGSSFAIDIARQIGLPEDILKNAASRAGEEHVNFDKHLREIIRDKRYWQEKRNRIRISEKQLTSLLQQYEDELTQTKLLRKETMEKARQEAGQILAQANREIEKTIRTIKENQADKEITRIARKELETYKSKLSDSGIPRDDNIEEKLGNIHKHSKRLKVRPEKEEPDTAAGNQPLQPGDQVYILHIDAEGEVLEISGENVLVAYGESLITSVKLSSIQKSRKKITDSGKRPQISSQFGYSINQRRLNFKSEIDIRGKRGQEAIDIVRNFVDDATIVGVSQLRILHGKGNGILKSLVREYLNALDIVKSCKDEHVDLGGSGITVVTLDF